MVPLWKKEGFMFTIPLQYTTYVNIAIIVFYIIFYYKGSNKGFLLQILSLIGTIVCFVVAWRYRVVGSKFFHLVPKEFVSKVFVLMTDELYLFIDQIAWFLLLFIVMKIILFFVEKMLGGLQKLPLIKTISGILGGIFGLVTATIWILIFCVILNTPLFSNGREFQNRTLLRTINQTVIAAFHSTTIPTQYVEAFNKLYTNVQDLDDSDKEAVEKWLIEQGFEPLEENDIAPNN